MLLIVFLILVIVTALGALSLLNKLDQKHRHERLRLRRLQAYSEDIQDLLTTLAETLPSPAILIAINAHLIEQFEEMLDIPDAPVDTLQLSLSAAQERQAQWQDAETSTGAGRYVRDSDAQIARTQMHINAALELLPLLAGKGQISAAQLSDYANQLRWAHLMISTMSFVAQGERAMAISDRFSGFAFYRKAQQLLMESLHNDPRRVKMIRELGEIIDGDRDQLSDDCKFQQELLQLN